MARCLSALILLSALAACSCGGGGGAAGNASLAWTPSPSPTVTGYRVYFGLASGQYLQPWGAGVNVGQVEAHLITGLTSGTLYYFAVTAFDADGNESAYSNEASKLIE